MVLLYSCSEICKHGSSKFHISRSILVAPDPFIAAHFKVLNTVYFYRNIKSGSGTLQLRSLLVSEDVIQHQLLNTKYICHVFVF